MKRVLLLLLGLILLILLSYFCFINKAESIRNDLVSTANNIYLSKHMEWVKPDLKGDKLGLTAIMTLKGIAPSEKAKIEAEKIAKNINGVQGVENLLVVKKTVTPSPYVLSVVKEKNGHVLLRGYVPNLDIHEEIVYLANKLFTKEKVTDELEEIEGAPKEWQDVSFLGLKSLKNIDYGKFNISDKNFIFEGYANSQEIKQNILNKIKTDLVSTFNANISINTPKIIKSKQVVTCQKEFNNLLANNKILFEYDKADIKKESFSLLNNLIKIAKKCPNTIITIEGHTDSTGSETYNQMLSQKRAIAVKNYLQTNGLINSKLETKGYGETKPIASNETKEGRLKNRRIELKVREEK